MAHVPVACVLSEAHLAYQLRLSPMRSWRKIRGFRCQRRSLALERSDAPVDFSQLILAEAGSDASRIVQLSLCIVIAEQQRTEVAARSPRVGPSNNDELLAAGALDLEPSASPLREIPGVGHLTALAFVAAIDEPDRFRGSRDVGPYLGLAPRRWKSGEIDYTGSISKVGDRRVRTLLEGTTERKLEGDVTKAIEVLSNRLSRTQDEQSSVLRHLIEGGETWPRRK